VATLEDQEPPSNSALLSLAKREADWSERRARMDGPSRDGRHVRPSKAAMEHPRLVPDELPFGCSTWRGSVTRFRQLSLSRWAGATSFSDTYLKREVPQAIASHLGAKSLL
jgi:hypothetical protein